ncbi:MAG: RidA family protein [Hyphomicrobiales bacterium]|nr:MAG: RidA family protein [Hyphomicrobiales bacterium]
MTITRYQPGKRLAAAVKHNNTLYLSGQVANDAKGTVEAQTKDILDQIDALLKEAGTDKSKVLMVNIYLPSMADFAAMNGAYDAWVDKNNLPARATIEARLADPNLRVEISAIAALD